MKEIKRILVCVLAMTMLLTNAISVKATEEITNEIVQDEDNQKIEQNIEEETDDMQNETSENSVSNSNNENATSDSQTEESASEAYEEAPEENSEVLDGLLENSWRYENGKLIEGIDNYSNQGRARSAQNTSSIVGIDVSEHQGIIDWNQVKASGMIDFVIIRCGYGQDLTKQDDKQWQRNVDR